MAVFDLPGPVFAWLDAQVGAVAAPGLRLVLWGVLAAIISMWVYRRLSAQERIKRGRVDIAEATRQLHAFDGEWDQARNLLGRMLGLAFRQVGRVGWPSVVASLPLLSLLAWLSNAYGYTWPEAGQAPAMRTDPAGLETQWLTGECARPDALGKCPRIIIRNGDRQIADVELAAPARVIHKRQWWNALLGNPGGYLPPEAPVESIQIDLPAREYLSLGPKWGRTWAALFFATLIVTSLLLKRWWRIA